MSMKLLLVGDEKELFFICEEVASHAFAGWECDVYTPENGHLDATAVLFRAKKGYDFIIYDGRTLLDDPDDIAVTIESVKKSNNITPIVVATSIDTRNSLVKACTERGMNHFINAGGGTAADWKEDFRKNVSGFYDGNKREELEAVKKARGKEKAIEKSVRTIGVAGLCHRIGTTTQAIQIVKYLTMKGKRACYVEMNETEYENRLRSIAQGETLSYVEKAMIYLETTDTDEKRGRVCIEGVDLYYKPEQLSNILAAGYDYIIYDYGAYRERGFNKAAFLKDDIQIFCCMIGAAEIDYLYELCFDVTYAKAKLLLGNVKDNDQENVCATLAGCDVELGRLYFTGYTPDPFSLDNPALYEELIPIDNPADDEKEKKDKPEKKKKKKRGFWR